MGELDESGARVVTWDGGPATASRTVGVGRGHLGEGWLIGHAINGGVLMALGARRPRRGWPRWATPT